ncbi:AraC family ligand binding domain-containing protein [Photobacterium profundum]|uniref:AraC family ligand binding domain-containing protein n=1 Tax=Photobacterium profundum TaxID=74109 RepID=UPI003D120D18
MKQAIEFTKNEQTYLHVGPRRKSHSSYFIVITKGSALIRLGKQECLVTQGTGFWVPFDCLHALTVLPGSHYFKVEFSVRLTTQLCREAGFFKVTELMSALLVELTKLSEKTQDWDSAFGRLLRVIADQVSELKVSNKHASPHLTKHYNDALAVLLTGEKVVDTAALNKITKLIDITIHEFQTCILLREALKLSRSGRKASQIAETLNTNEATLNALAISVLGEQF